MGLGPPVCLDCKRIMEHHKQFPFWKCAECGKTNQDDKGVSSLFCLTREEAKEYEAKENR